MIPIPQNAAHWHTILAHIPAILFMASAVILALATWWKDGRWQRVALGFIVASVILTAITFKMGEEGEDIAKKLPDTKEYIHPHEELAETARYIIIPLGILILVLWWFTRKHALLPQWAAWSVVAVLFGAVLLLANVASLGGKINHPEARPGWSGAGGHDHDDDGLEDHDDHDHD